MALLALLIQVVQVARLVQKPLVALDYRVRQSFLVDLQVRLVLTLVDQHYLLAPGVQVDLHHHLDL